MLWIVCAHLVFLPWALGTMRLWAQLISLGFAIVGIVVALIPRDYTEEFTSGADFRLYTWPKLVRFPIFWAGLALLLYITLQALNPAWHYVEQDGRWWMESIAHLNWLPHGTNNPFTLGGPWRVLIVYASAWLLVSSIWIGFTRRRTLQILFIALAANGLVLAGFALLQRVLGNGRMFWFWKPNSASFFGSFVYKNHAGAYLLIILVLCAGLAAWFHLRGLRRMEKSNPSGVFVFFSVLLAVSIIVSYARGATIFMALFAVLAALTFFAFYWRRQTHSGRALVALVIFGGVAAFAYVGLTALSAEKAWARMGRLLDEENTSVRSRQIATAASWDMVQANWQWGTGAGSFRFLFPLYQQHHPEIFQNGRRRLFWDHAHNDFMQIPAELGVFGVFAILFSSGFWAWRLLRFYFWENALSLIVCLGALVVMAHSWTDFLFQNPAILLTWCALWPAIALWTEYEEKGARS